MSAERDVEKVLAMLATIRESLTPMEAYYLMTIIYCQLERSMIREGIEEGYTLLEMRDWFRRSFEMNVKSYQKHVGDRHHERSHTN